MGNINAFDKIMCETRNKRKNMEIKEFLHISPSNRSFRHRIHCLLRPVDARESADIYRI